MRPSSWSSRRATWSAARSTRRSGPAGGSTARTTSTSTSATSGARSSRRSCPTSPTSPGSTRASSRITEPVPIQPTAHYAMGGIPTDLDARVTRDAAGTVVPGPVRGGRVRLRQRPRRQPAGHELARRPARVRPAGRAPDGRPTCAGVGIAGRRRRRRTTPVRAELEAIRARPTGGERAAAHPQGARRRDDGRRRRVPRRRRPAPRPGEASRELRDRYRERARAGQGHGLQHRPARGARAGLPARLRRDDRRRGARPQGEPRRARPRGLPRARRRSVPGPHARDEAGRPRSRWPTSR